MQTDHLIKRSHCAYNAASAACRGPSAAAGDCYASYPTFFLRILLTDITTLWNRMKFKLAITKVFTIGNLRFALFWSQINHTVERRLYTTAAHMTTDVPIRSAFTQVVLFPSFWLLRLCKLELYQEQYWFIEKWAISIPLRRWCSCTKIVWIKFSIHLFIVRTSVTSENSWTLLLSD